MREEKRQYSDGNIDIENPAPIELIGNPTAERRPNRGSGNDRHAIECECTRKLTFWKSVDENRLFAGSQTAPAHALQYAKKNEHTETRCKSAQKRTDGEKRHA